MDMNIDIDYSKRTQLYEGKAKIVSVLDENPEHVVMYFKDDATAFNAEKKSQFDGKGELNCWISDYLLQAMDNLGIRTHFIEKINEREIVARKLKIIPIEVIVRNVAAGTFCKRYGLPHGTPLPKHIVEFCVKDDDLGDPPIDPEAIDALGLCHPTDLMRIKAITNDVNKYLKAIFYQIGLKLVDFKLEFGFDIDPQGLVGNTIYLADEICPDTMRLWDFETNESFDKDLFRFDKGDLLAGYKEVKRRLQAWQG